MRRTAAARALAIASGVLASAGCGRSPQPPELTPVAVRIEALLPLHPAWRDYVAASPARSAAGSMASVGTPQAVTAAAELPRRLVYDVPGMAVGAAEPLASSDRIEELRPSYERRNAALVGSAQRQRLRQLQAIRSPSAAALVRSDALAEALYNSQHNQQVVPLEAKILALQSQMDAWSGDKATREPIQLQIDRERAKVDEIEAKLKLDLAQRRAEGAQRILDDRDREAEAIRQELVLLEAERNAEIGRQISAYKQAVAKGRRDIQPLTGSVVPRPVVPTPPTLREPPQPVAPLQRARVDLPADSQRPIAKEALLQFIRRDIERQVQRAAASRGWRPVYSANAGLPDRTDVLRTMLLAESRP